MVVEKVKHIHDDSRIIESAILSEKGDWQFDKNVSRVFDTHVRKSIPCYDEIQYLISTISKDFIKDKSKVYDLGTATAEVILNISNVNPSKEIHFVGIDSSKHMLQKAEQKCKGIKNVTLLNSDLEHFEFDPSDLIISAFTLQFVNPGKRKAILKNIRNSLKQGGGFILCEKILFNDQETTDFFQGIYEEWKEIYYTKGEISSKNERLKSVMIPLTISDNLAMLKSVGFSEINIFFQWCNFIGILAK